MAKDNEQSQALERALDCYNQEIASIHCRGININPHEVAVTALNLRWLFSKSQDEIRSNITRWNQAPPEIRRRPLNAAMLSAAYAGLATLSH